MRSTMTTGGVAERGTTVVAPLPDLETSLDWVTFSEEDSGKPCQSLLKCSNEAVYRVKWLVNCCHGDMDICASCADKSMKFVGVDGYCPGCGADPQKIVSILPIGPR